MLDSMAHLQRLSSRARRHGESMYTEKENDKGAGRRERVPKRCGIWLVQELQGMSRR